VPTLNLGILAHVDAGKTSLTERLLLNAGVIAELGSVDAGSTQTDSLALERARGITIKSAVVSFAVGDTTVNLIDTPGHPDFIAEVERVLGVLDGAVLVVSAVEGVQAQTRVLMRTLRRLRIPTLVFVNKTDRTGADPDRVVRDLNARLAPVIPLDRAAELLAEHDDEALAAYVDGKPLSRDLLVARTRDATVHPVFAGSAVTGAGVAELTDAIVSMLPATDTDAATATDTATDTDAHAPLSGTVFKVERGPAGEKIAYARLFSGSVRVRDRVPLGSDRVGKVTAVRVFDGGGPVLTAGRIGKLWGLTEVRVGDAIGTPRSAGHEHFPPPTLATVVEPVHAADRITLHKALTQLAESDPLINLRDGLAVSLYGEVQKEVIEATLADEYGIAVTFRETTTICIERPVGAGAAVELIGENPYPATVGLRVEPGPVDSGVRFALAVELGSLPLSFFTAVEETVRAELRAGGRWEVTDCVVTMTHSGYSSPVTVAGHFRDLTRVVLRAALARAGTRVYEPVLRFRLEVPADVVGTTLPALTRLRAVPHTTRPAGPTQVIEGDIPAADVHALERGLPALTHGEGVLESAFHHYQARY